MEVMVEDFGVFLSKKSERVQLKKDGKVFAEHALFNVDQITIANRGISLSVDLIEDCMERGIQINFMSSSGKPYAKITSPSLNATVVTRREQMMAYLDERAKQFACEIVAAKTKNQINLLKYFGKYRRNAAPELFEDIQASIEKMEKIRSSIDKLPDLNIDEIRGQLLSIEGRIGEAYWNSIGQIIPEELGFEGREHQNAKDPVNSAINYGYGILYSRVWGAIILAGLEPFAGFLHVDRPGKPSLVLDMVEEFRQPVVDRAIFGWLNKGGKISLDDEGLTKDTRSEIAARVIERLDGVESYEGKKQKLRHIIQEQSRRLATFLRGQRRYEAFVSAW
ncbi:MAG: CRISPR-associated endonuclease Cas1 [Candidatus Obscuribacterales bacterium]|nr:CRISPR-associated endonuclease Cas1 [Candidatus Obscuribacterales bacterium]